MLRKFFRKNELHAANEIYNGYILGKKYPAYRSLEYLWNSDIESIEVDENAVFAKLKKDSKGRYSGKDKFLIGSIEELEGGYCEVFIIDRYKSYKVIKGPFNFYFAPTLIASHYDRHLDNSGKLSGRLWKS